MFLCTENLKITLRARKFEKYENYYHLMFYFAILLPSSLQVEFVKTKNMFDLASSSI